MEISLPTEEQIELIARAIAAKSTDEEFYNRLVDEMTSNFEMTDNDREHFRRGLTYGFIYCFYGVHRLISKHKESGK